MDRCAPCTDKGCVESRPTLGCSQTTGSVDDHVQENIPGNDKPHDAHGCFAAEMYEIPRRFRPRSDKAPSSEGITVEMETPRRPHPVGDEGSSVSSDTQEPRWRHANVYADERNDTGPLVTQSLIVSEDLCPTQSGLRSSPDSIPDIPALDRALRESSEDPNVICENSSNANYTLSDSTIIGKEVNINRTYQPDVPSSSYYDTQQVPPVGVVTLDDSLFSAEYSVHSHDVSDKHRSASDQLPSNVNAERTPTPTGNSSSSQRKSRLAKKKAAWRIANYFKH